jgi:hypothetical protein
LGPVFLTGKDAPFYQQFQSGQWKSIKESVLITHRIQTFLPIKQFYGYSKIALPSKNTELYM